MLLHVALMDSVQLWLSSQDQDKTGPLQVSSWTGEEPIIQQFPPQIKLFSGRKVFKKPDVVRGGKAFQPSGKLLKLRK